MVVVDHPLGGISEDQLAQRIDVAYEQVVRLLQEAVDEDAPAPPSADGAMAEASSHTDAVEGALDELRQALANDGAGLQVERADEEQITVALTFADETCMDCVVPPPILRSIIADAMQRGGFGQDVTVVDPRTT